MFHLPVSFVKCFYFSKKDQKRIELDTRIQASIDAERKQAMEIEEKRREEKRKLDEEKREQRRKEKERKKLLGQRKRLLNKFVHDHEFLVTKTLPPILWVPAKHNISTKKMLLERKTENFEEPFPELIPFLQSQTEHESEETSPINIRESLDSPPNDRSIESPEHEKFSGNEQKEKDSTKKEDSSATNDNDEKEGGEEEDADKKR